MNYKRGYPKRQVRCTLCTEHRWYGNSKYRKPFRDHRETAGDPIAEGFVDLEEEKVDLEEEKVDQMWRDFWADEQWLESLRNAA